MFEFLFKYPPSVFSKGTFVLLGSWPHWVLTAAILATAGLLAWTIWHRRARLASSMHGTRAVVVWALQSALVALMLFLLWEPALSVAALKPQQNIIAVLADDSRSMAILDSSQSRQEEAIKLLDGLLKDLQGRFLVRLYRLGAGVERIQNTGQLKPVESATQIGKGLQQIAEEAATLPIGAVVLLSDGADNSGRRRPANAVRASAKTAAGEHRRNR